MRKTPYMAKVYFLLAAFLIALPTIGSQFYNGQTGRFLVASEHLSGGVFGESVIYIVKHNLFGAYGLVINKPLSPEQLEPLALQNIDAVIYAGGPVGVTDNFSVLVADDPSHLRDVFIYKATSELIDLGQKQYPYQQIYIGYSGWGPLQLEMEILRGSWAIISEPTDIIFDREGHSDLWWLLYNKDGVSQPYI